MKSFLDMPPEDGTELFKTVVLEILGRVHNISQELNDLRQFIVQNEDVTKALGINLIFHVMSRDPKTLNITTDCRCIIGLQKDLHNNLRECFKAIMEGGKE